MKIIVFSDSHGSVSPMEKVIDREKPDFVIHLGDRTGDCDLLSGKGTAIYRICGNNDFGDFSLTESFNIEGKKIFACHGHTFGVKSGIERLLSHAATLGADVVLYGHTHEPTCGPEGKIIVMNPGSVRDTATYGKLEIKDGKIRAGIERI